MERVTGIALWRQIQQALAAEIRAGGLKPGDRLPTEAELAERFGVNRHTLRRAVAALQEEGLVRVEQGRGTFVQEDVVDYLVARRTRFSENMIGEDRRPGGRLLRTQELPAPAEIAKALGVRRGAPLLLIDNLYEADGRPLTVASHYFPLPRFQGLDQAYRELGSITAALFQLGVKDYLRQVTRVTTRLAEPEEARLLQQARSQPVLVSESVNVDLAGRPIEYVLSRAAGQRMQLVFEP